MITNTTVAFKDIHVCFTTHLSTSHASDMQFFERASCEAGALSEPLIEESVEAIFSRDGKRVHETFKIGERVEKFKNFVEKEEAQLREYWKLWDEVQNEYLELGVGVFGEKSFGEDGKAFMDVQHGGSKAWKRAKELLDLEHETKVQEVEEDIGGIKEESIRAMKTSEKVSY